MNKILYLRADVCVCVCVCVFGGCQIKHVDAEEEIMSRGNISEVHDACIVHLQHACTLQTKKKQTKQKKTAAVVVGVGGREEVELSTTV